MKAHQPCLSTSFLYLFAWSCGTVTSTVRLWLDTVYYPLCSCYQFIRLLMCELFAPLGLNLVDESVQLVSGRIFLALIKGLDGCL